ncbi:unnamed protein product [Aphanomyces euteiches]
MSSSTTAAKNDAVAYEINVAKTANQLIDHVVSGSRFAFETNLVWKATVKPCSWYNDVVSLVETSGQVERVNQTKAWKQVTSSPPRSFSALSTSSVPQEEALVRHVVGHSAKDDLVVCVDAFASNCNRAFQQWCNKMTYLTTHYDVARWCHADGNTRQDLLKDLQALNQQDDRRLEQPTLLDFNDSGDDIPDESSLIRFLARTPLYTTQVATRTELRALLREFRLSLDLSTSTFRQWWLTGLHPREKEVQTRLQALGILSGDGTLKDPFRWNLLALFAQSERVETNSQVVADPVDRASDMVEAYEEDVTLAYHAIEKPSAWFSDVASTIDSSGNYSRVWSNGQDGWIAAGAAESPRHDAMIPQLGSLLASIVSKQETIRSRRDLLLHVGAFFSNHELVVENLEKSMEAIDILLECSSPQSYEWQENKVVSHNEMHNVVPIIPDEAELVAFLANNPTRLCAAQTQQSFSSLILYFRLSLPLSSSFRMWWMSSWKAPAKIILKQLRRRGILMTRSKSQPLLWNIVALIDQAFKRPPLCFAQADVTEPIWNADMVDVFADMAAEVFVQEALQHLKTADDVYLTATIANKLNLQRLSIAMNKSEFVDRVVDKMTKSSKLIVATDAQKERIVVLAPSEDHSLAYDADDVSSRLEDDGVEPQFEDKHAKYKTKICWHWSAQGSCVHDDGCSYAHGEHELRKQTTTWADNDIDRCEQVFKQKNAIFTSSRQVHGLEHNVQQCVALAAAILDRNGYYSATTWRHFTRQDSDLVVQSLQPFAIVLPGTPMMFWKKRELCAVQNGQSLDSTAEEWIEWYIQKVEKQISNTRVALAKVCLAGNLEGIVKAKCKIERRPFYKKLAKEVQVAQMILDALERNQDDTTTASVADSSSSSTSGQSKAKDGNKLISDDGNVLDREPLARSSLQQLKLDYPRKESASPEKLPWRYSNSSKTATERGYHEVENRLYKTVICYRWRNDGVCYFGNRCHYAHGEWELRPKSGNAQYNRRNPSFPDQNRSTANDSWRNRSFEMHEAKSSNGVSMATYFKASSPAQHETDSSTVE